MCSFAHPLGQAHVLFRSISMNISSQPSLARYGSAQPGLAGWASWAWVDDKGSMVAHQTQPDGLIGRKHYVRTVIICKYISLPARTSSAGWMGSAKARSVVQSVLARDILFPTGFGLRIYKAAPGLRCRPPFIRLLLQFGRSLTRSDQAVCRVSQYIYACHSGSGRPVWLVR